MTISQVVQSGLFANDSQQLIRIPLRADEGVLSRRRRARREKKMKTCSKRSLLLWKTEEHARFLEALEFYPSGPWKVIAEHVGTRTTRQVMTHAQKYREKIERRRQKQEEGSMGVGCVTPRSQTSDTSSSYSPLSVYSDSDGFSLEDAEERAILLDFLDNFQASDLEQVDPPPNDHDGYYEELEVMLAPHTTPNVSTYF
ncbi:hypothetical protein PHYBOEH_008112 [Phytophthora boehmeriae]|uniref:Myb-like DNA-binding protein n=1 Tax=Phytophthora boehmeriae TaxID=109152 RepID=A0A8T1W1W2_9STRA|nr:hypothetical protein PHYBOEH_008112 [Phytophthora boehmeriae]